MLLRRPLLLPPPPLLSPVLRVAMPLPLRPSPPRGGVWTMRTLRMLLAGGVWTMPAARVWPMLALLMLLHRPLRLLPPPPLSLRLSPLGGGVRTIITMWIVMKLSAAQVLPALALLMLQHRPLLLRRPPPLSLVLVPRLLCLLLLLLFTPRSFARVWPMLVRLMLPLPLLLPLLPPLLSPMLLPVQVPVQVPLPPHPRSAPPAGSTAPAPASGSTRTWSGICWRSGLRTQALGVPLGQGERGVSPVVRREGSMGGLVSRGARGARGTKTLSFWTPISFSCLVASIFRRGDEKAFDGLMKFTITKETNISSYQS
jgi:hypothetical protein